MTDEPTTPGQYPGDTGELDVETRRAFVQLLKGRSSPRPSIPRCGAR